MGAHGHGHADGSEDHGDEADEAEESGGVVEAAGELRTGFAEVGDLRVGENLFELGTEGADVLGFTVSGVVDLEEIALAGATAEAEESAVQHGAAGDHDARAEADSGGHAVRLAHDDGCDTEMLRSDLEGVADFGVEADEEVVVDENSGVIEQVAQFSGRAENDVSVKGINGGIDGLERDEQRDGVALHGGHRDRLRHAGALDAAGSERVKLLLLFRSGEAEHARGEVGGHDAAGVAKKSPLKCVAEAAYAGEGCDSDGDGEQDENELRP